MILWLATLLRTAKPVFSLAGVKYGSRKTVGIFTDTYTLTSMARRDVL